MCIFVVCYLLTVDAKSNTAKDNVVDGSIETVKEYAAEAAKVSSEYAEILADKAADAAEIGNEYLAHGADIAKEYAT